MNHPSRGRHRCAWAAATLLAAAGCGGGDRLETVSGTVVFTDGRSVTGGVVEFDPLAENGMPARAAIGTDGSFTLRSGAASGVRSGRYRVAVVHHVADPGITFHRGHHPRVHPRFGRYDTSGLVEDVVAGRPNSLRIVVEAMPVNGGR